MLSLIRAFALGLALISAGTGAMATVKHHPGDGALPSGLDQPKGNGPRDDWWQEGHDWWPEQQNGVWWRDEPSGTQDRQHWLFETHDRRGTGPWWEDRRWKRKLGFLCQSRFADLRRCAGDRRVVEIPPTPETAAIPLPAGLPLLSAGLAALLLFRRRR